MCSSKCPCAGVEQQKQWTSLTNEETIKNYGRDQKKIPFVFNNGSKGVENFRQCIKKISEGDGNDSFTKQAKKITGLKGYKQAADFLAFLEGELQCTGFCVPTLFHFAIPTSKGLPAKEACMPQFTATVGDNLFEVGLASLLAGLVMSCLFCWQYCLWKKYD